MKKLLLLLLPLLALTFTACEEDDAELTFTTENNTDPGNITVEYYSPDPSCVDRMYWITAGSQGGELTLRCNNADAIFINNTANGATPSSYTSTRGSWTARIVSPNTVTITFDPIDDLDSLNTNDYLTLASNTKKGLASTSLYIHRL